MDFILYANDTTDQHALNRRLNCRDEHLQRAIQIKWMDGWMDGWIKFAGAL